MKTYNVTFEDKLIDILRVESNEDTLIDVSSKVSDHYSDRKLFNYLFVNFGDLFALDKYKMEKDAEVINTVLADSVVPAFDVIKKFANQPRALTLQENKEFLDAFKVIYSILNDQYTWMDDDRFIVPLKGGGVITSLFEISDEKLIAIDSKRLPFKDHKTFGFGMHVKNVKDSESTQKVEEFYQSMNGKTLAILEICVMSGMTTCAYLLDLHLQNIKPKKIRVIASVISQQGMQFVNAFAQSLGYEIEWVTARIVNTVGDFYANLNDVLLNEDNTLILRSPWDAYQQVKGA